MSPDPYVGTFTAQGGQIKREPPRSPLKSWPAPGRAHFVADDETPGAERDGAESVSAEVYRSPEWIVPPER